jgi:hypothetical protein
MPGFLGPHQPHVAELGSVFAGDSSNAWQVQPDPFRTFLSPGVSGRLGGMAFTPHHPP